MKAFGVYSSRYIVSLPSTCMLLPWRQILISSYRTRKNVNLNGDTQYLHSNSDIQPNEVLELRVQTLEESAVQDVQPGGLLRHSGAQVQGGCALRQGE